MTTRARPTAALALSAAAFAAFAAASQATGAAARFAGIPAGLALAIACAGAAAAAAGWAAPARGGRAGLLGAGVFVLFFAGVALSLAARGESPLGPALEGGALLAAACAAGELGAFARRRRQTRT
jgi:hypothetical protein